MGNSIQSQILCETYYKVFIPIGYNKVKGDDGKEPLNWDKQCWSTEHNSPPSVYLRLIGGLSFLAK